MSSEFKKKKLVVPAVTLLVAVAMMMGVGYAALTSTFETTSNNVVGGEFKVTVNDVSGEAMFTDAKIPYSTNTKNGTLSYSVGDGEYIILPSKTISITDNTGLGTNYKLTGKVEDSLGNPITVLGKNVIVKINGSDASSGVNVTNPSDITMTVSVTFAGTETLTNPSELSISNIVVKIFAEHTSS